MKKVALSLLVILFSSVTNSQNNFENLWENVQKFELENLSKSALTEVEIIYSKFYSIKINYF